MQHTIATIAVIFDFDDTLAPDSTSGFLQDLGVDVKAFWQQVKPLVDAGWDPIPAYLFELINLSNSDNPATRITRERLAQWGRKIKFFNGVTKIFGVLRDHTKSVSNNCAVEFYLISSGIGEILRATSIVRQFSDIWSCDFDYQADGRIRFPKNIVSFTDKTRYIFHISKGIIGPEWRGKPFEVNRKIQSRNLKIPLHQMIFVGDGYTDVPCFSLIRNSGGIAIGVYDPTHREHWGRAWGFIEQERVSNLVPADFGKNAALTNSLLMAIESMAKKIDLDRNTYQG